MNATDKNRQNPLHVAAIEDKAAILEVLLQNGADPDLVDSNLNNGKLILIFVICMVWSGEYDTFFSYCVLYRGNMGVYY